MSDEILVNHAGLADASRQLLTSATQIDDRLNTLESELAALRTAWTGSAQEAYQRAKQVWDTAIGEMIGLLRQSGSMVDQSNADYRAADLRGAARFE